MRKNNIHPPSEQGLTVGSRFKYVRKSLNLTQKQFAESLGIVQGFLSAIEKDRKTPSVTLLIALEHLYRVSTEWIHTGLGESAASNHNPSTQQRENFAGIPLLINLPATAEAFHATTGHERYISLPGIPGDGFAFEYTGDYMLPTIRDGDIIIIKPTSTLTSGTIGLITGKWGEPLLRRYREINGDRYFSSDNTAYATFQPDDSTRILGLVVKVWREIKT